MPALTQPKGQPVAVHPVHYDPDFPLMFGGTGAWQVYDYASVQKVLFDHEHFSNVYMPQTEEYAIGSNLNQTDPPLHSKLRGLITRPFTKTAIVVLEGPIRQQVNALLDNHLPISQMDFARDFAFPLSAATIGQVLGIPESAYTEVNEWARAIVTAGYVAGGMEAAMAAQQQMFQFFYELLEARKQKPEGDLLTDLSTASIDGQEVTTPVKVATCMTILLAGHETTAALLTNALLAFIELPELQAALRKHPEKIPSALLEVLRLRPSLLSMYRKASCDLELEGQRITEGDIINAWICTANRDPAVFSQPDHFNPDRDNHSRILSFGHGIHRCVGDTLAKTEARIAFEAILSRMEDIHMLPSSGPIFTESRITSGFQSLPIAFTKKT